MGRTKSFVFAFTLVLFAGLSDVSALAAEAIDFAHEVAPILRKHCVKCHIGDEPKGDFSMNDADAFAQSIVNMGGDGAGGQRLLELVTSEDEDDRMPPKDASRLSESERETLVRWVSQKTPWTVGLKFSGSAYEPPVLRRAVELPPVRNGRDHPIDRILDQYLIDRDRPPCEPADDYTFVRRAYLDLIGLLPSPGEVRDFASDSASDKHAKLVQRLLGDKTAYSEHWLTFWNDWLRNDYAGTGFITGGRKQISRWLYDSLMTNKPYDQFSRELVAAKTPASSGFADGIKWRGTVSAAQGLEVQYSQSIAQAFLGINMKCASCHDSFIDQWKLSDAYALAAVYADGPLDIYRCDKPTGETATAAWIFPEIGELDPDASRRDRLDQLAELMTDSKNGRFARTIVNRLWAQLMGRGIVHPLDAMHTRPFNEPLLDYLANYLVDQDYDLKKVLAHIATSQAYRSRSEVVAQQAESNDSYVYSGPRAKRMTAEQFMDAVWTLTKAAPKSFDAPVVRGEFGEIDSSNVQLDAKWIAADQQPQNADEPSTKEPVGPWVFRKRVDLPEEVRHATAVVTADAGFELFVGNRRQAESKQITPVTAVSLTTLLKKGATNLVVVVTPQKDATQNAVLYFEARVLLDSGEELIFASDTSWDVMSGAPVGGKEGRLGKLKGPWRKAIAVDYSGPKAAAVMQQSRQAIARGEAERKLPIRASLLKSDFLTRALGRPNRDQIVTSRPSDLTTLEAIELANNESLAAMIRKGAQRLHQQHPDDVATAAETLAMQAFCRPLTEAERETLMAAFDAAQPQQSIEDWLWAFLMTPEFMMVR